jgi:hypothetical protein
MSLASKQYLLGTALAAVPSQAARRLGLGIGENYFCFA